MQQAALAKETAEAIADRAAQLAAHEAKIAAIQEKLGKQQWVIGQTRGGFAFLKTPRFRQWAVYLAIIGLLLANISWAAQGKINDHYEACAGAQSFVSSIAAEAHRKKLTAIERFIEIPRVPGGCY